MLVDAISWFVARRTFLLVPRWPWRTATPGTVFVVDERSIVQIAGSRLDSPTRQNRGPFGLEAGDRLVDDLKAKVGPGDTVIPVEPDGGPAAPSPK